MLRLAVNDRADKVTERARVLHWTCSLIMQSSLFYYECKWPVNHDGTPRRYLAPMLAFQAASSPAMSKEYTLLSALS